MRRFNLKRHEANVHQHETESMDENSDSDDERSLVTDIEESQDERSGETDESDEENNSTDDNSSDSEENIMGSNDVHQSTLMMKLLDEVYRDSAYDHERLVDQYSSSMSKEEAISQASRTLLPQYRAAFKAKFTRMLVAFNRMRKAPFYRQIMRTVRNLKDEEDMDDDEALYAGISKRKLLLYRMVKPPPIDYYETLSQ